MDRTRAFLLGLIAALLALSVALVMPFLNYFLLAVLLAYILRPLQLRLQRHVSARTAAAIIVVVAAVTIIAPMLYVLQIALVEGTRMLRSIRQGEITFAAVEQSIFEITGMEIDLASSARTAASDVGPTAIDSLFGIVSAAVHVMIGLGLALFLLFYFLKDGPAFVSWLRETMPLPVHVEDELFAEIDNIMWAVLAGHVFVAFVQGTIAGLGLIVLGVPNAIFWTAVMIVLSLLPIIGSFMVWGPAAGYLFVTGDSTAAVTLLIYGTIVVGISDDYLRPIVVDRYAELNPAVVILGVLGGIYVIGFMGIFFGPIVLGSLKAALDVFYREDATAPG